MSAKVGLISLHLLVSLVLVAAYYKNLLGKQSTIMSGLWAVSLFVCILMYIPKISKGAIYLHLVVSALAFMAMTKFFMDARKKKVLPELSGDPIVNPGILDVSFWAISFGVCIALSVVS